VDRIDDCGDAPRTMTTDDGTSTTPRMGLRTAHLFLLLPWIAVGVAALRPIRDNSFLWHVRAGTLQLDRGEVLRQDPFSFTFGGEPWRTQSWLIDLLYGHLERTFGPGLGWVPWMNLIVFATAMALVGALAWRWAQSVPATVIALFATAWLAIPYVNPRPVAFSFVAVTALALAIDRRLRWAIPLIIWVWAAAHGSFVMGIGLVVLVGLQRRDRAAVRDAVASVVAASLTAHGLASWGILASFSGSREALSLIVEWQPPNLTEIPVVPYAGLIALMLVGAARGALRQNELWVVVPFLLFGLTSSRAIIVATLVLAPYAARILADLLPIGGLARSGKPPVVVIGAVGTIMLVLPLLISPEPGGLDDERFPVAAAPALDPVPTFHGDADGGYLIYAEWPELEVFVDDRAELYGGDFFHALVDTRGAAPGWEDVMDEWGIEQVLISSESPLAGALEVDAAWEQTYADDRFAIYRR
jgi:hypothetical protein